MKKILLVLFFPLLVFAGAGTFIQGGDTVKGLKDIYEFKSGGTIEYGTNSFTFKSYNNTDFLRFSSSGGLEITSDGGESWSPVASESGETIIRESGVNFVSDSNFESGISGWTTYQDTSADTPVDGTGGTSTITLAHETVNPLRGDGSLSITIPASDVRGQGVAYSFEVDNADQSHFVEVTFDFDLSDVNYENGDLALFVYDETNAEIINMLSGADILAGTGVHYAYFTAASDSKNYRILIHNTTTETDGFSGVIEGFRIRPTMRPEESSEFYVSMYGSTDTVGPTFVRDVQFTTVTDGAEYVTSNLTVNLPADGMYVADGFARTVATANTIFNGDVAINGIVGGGRHPLNLWEQRAKNNSTSSGQLSGQGMVVFKGYKGDQVVLRLYSDSGSAVDLQEASFRVYQLNQPKVNITYGQDSSGGGGGSAGINFVVDESFENEELVPTVTPSLTTSYPEYAEDEELYSEFNAKYWRATGNVASETALNIGTTINRAGLDGKQGFFSVWARVTTPDDYPLKACVSVDDATFASDCDDALTVTLKGDGEWRKVEIPFVYGSTSAQFRFFNAAFAGDITVDLDKVYIGTVPDGYSIALQEIDTTRTEWQDFDSVAIGDLITSTGTNPTYGTVVTNKARWRRDGSDMLIEWDYSQNAIGSGTAGSGVYLFNLPNGYEIDTDIKLINTNTSEVDSTRDFTSSVGTANFNYVNGTNDSSFASGVLTPYSSTQIKAVLHFTNDEGISDYRYWGSTGYSFGNGAGGISVAFRARVPIKGWSTETTTIAKQATLSPDSAGFVFMPLLEIPESDTYLKADGRCVLRSKYPDYIKNGALDTYGTCTVTTTDDGVYLPDLRGYFPRFLDDLGTSQGAASVDVDGTSRTVGEAQESTLIRDQNSSARVADGGATVLNADGSTSQTTSYLQITNYTTGSTSTTYSKVRPVNMGFIPYVRMVDRNLIVGVLEQIEEVSIDLDASTDNILSGTFSLSTDTASFDHYSNAITVSSPSTGLGTIDYSSLGLTQPPRIIAKYLGGDTTTNIRNVEVYDITATGATVNCKASDTGTTTHINFDCAASFVLVKHDDDYNKKLTGAIVNASKNPRAALQDQYSETEIKWGLWNGEQLYRRCFTVGSDITSASTIATWDTGLVPKGLTNYIGTYWLIQARSTSANEALLAYDSSNGEIGAFFTGTSYKIGAGTTHCLEYTK